MATESPTPLTVSVEQAAELTSMHRATIWRHIAAGGLKAKKVGRRTLVDYQSLCELVGVEP